LNTASLQYSNLNNISLGFSVFGPPGTGKTTTICEAILQVMKLRLNSHILVTADSNSTCDDITIRLLKFIDEDKIIFRIYSSSKFEEIPEDLKHVSNFRNSLSEDEDTLSLDDFKKARIIVCTLVTCGQIVGIHHKLRAGHFDYIFIDEAGCQSEQNTLIPIAGLAYTKFKGITSQIILSGDHKQLGAVVKCEKSKEMGMEISMMERMMTIVPKYKEFREDCVSYLVKNYRSHKAIIEFSNTQFYNGKLEYLCPSEKKDFAVGWESLRNKQFPVLFHHSSSDRKFVGKSSINYGEAKIALNYVKSLMKNGISGKFVKREDIGVIAPYKAQVYLLDKIINKIYRKIEVGTVNAFQVTSIKLTYKLQYKY
jgi:helicase MOV-10